MRLLARAPELSLAVALGLAGLSAPQAPAADDEAARARAQLVEAMAQQGIRLAPELGLCSLPVRVAIRDEQGQTVRTLELGAQSEGLATFTWDGLDDDGEPVPAGRYSFTAAYRSGTESVAADTLLRAPIDSVLLGEDGFTVELRGIGEMPFTAVREIRNETAPAPPAGEATN